MSIWKKALYVAGATVGVVTLGIVVNQMLQPDSETSEETAKDVAEVTTEAAQEFFSKLFK